MENNNILRIFYTFFLGILLAIFIGVGISTFYAAPKSPIYPVELNSYGKEMTVQQQNQQRDFDKKIEEYNKQIKPYNRNVSIFALVASVLLLIVSLVFEKKIKIIADGVLLGGLFTLLYSIGRSFASENNKYVFAVITASLVIVLYLGYHRFVRTTKPVKAKG